MVKNLLDELFSGMRGNKTRQGRHRDLVRGDIVCVEDDLLKRYGVWTGNKFIFYGKNRNGVRIVHEVSFDDFLQGSEHYAICEFPKEYGRPTEWEHTSSISGVVMPEHKIWEMLERAWKKRKYKRYGHEETARRAESRIGSDGYGTSEHFAMWCKTGIAESHELESIRDFWERMIVY